MRVKNYAHYTLYTFLQKIFKGVPLTYEKKSKKKPATRIFSWPAGPEKSKKSAFFAKNIQGGRPHLWKKVRNQDTSFDPLIPKNAKKNSRGVPLTYEKNPKKSPQSGHFPWPADPEIRKKNAFFAKKISMGVPLTNE